MKDMKNIIYMCLFALLVLSCNKSMDEINTNPDKPTVVPPKYLATRVILNMLSNSTGKNFANDLWLMKGLANNELPEGYMYNSIGSSDVTYTQLINAKKMIELVESDATIPESGKKSYRALNNFVKSWKFFVSTMELGDIPCSEALKGEEGKRKPIYDTQEEVFTTIITLLDEASTLFAESAKFDGDIVYGGDPKLWEKATNVFLLRVLINLSNKTTVGTYNVKSKFEEVAQRPLFKNFSEDFELAYSNSANQFYPFNNTLHSYSNTIYMQEFLVDMLKKYNDRRLFYFAQPADSLIRAGHLPNSFDAYSGVDGTMPHADLRKVTDDGKHSNLNLRYSEDRGCEPVKKLSYAEVNFILAEAALKGWVTPSNAETHYNNAVTASIEFTTKHTKTEYRYGITIDSAYIKDYLTTYANFSSSTNKLELVLEQKYIAGFMQMKWNSWFDYRRTSYPKIPINPETSQNVDYKDRMPVRWTYPSTEYSTNFENLSVAIERQFGGKIETQNHIMWLLQ